MLLRNQIIERKVVDLITITKAAKFAEVNAL